MLDGRLTRGATPAADRVRALAFLELDRRLVRDGFWGPVVVGLSGGSDSLALLRLVADWARVWRRPVVAVTVDHGLSPHAAGWSRFARAAAERVGAEWLEVGWEGPRPASGLPAAARRARHALLAEATRDLGSEVLLLAHTADDLSEGETMRAGDAPGLGRLRVWAPSPVWPEGRGVFVLRPLLRVRRRRLRDWLLQEGERVWVEDPANADLRFARARVRAARGRTTLVRPATASPELRRLALRAEVGVDGVIVTRRRDLRLASPEAARALLSIACVCAGGGERPPRGRAVAALLAEVGGEAAVDRTLAGAHVIADGAAVVFARELGARPRGGRSAPAAPLVPGAPRVWDGRFLMEVDAPGLLVDALAPNLDRLPEEVAAAVRPADPRRWRALPVLLRPDGTARLPTPFGHEGRRADDEAEALVEARFHAACGVVRGEVDLA